MGYLFPIGPTKTNNKDYAMRNVQPNLASYAADAIRMDLLMGFLPMDVVTLLDAVAYYRDQYQPLVVAGLSQILEDNLGCGNRSIGIFLL